MRVVRYRLAPGDPVARRGTVVTIGAFDGLHVGHQAILRKVRRVAESRGLVSTVMSFEPTPKEFFAGAESPARLMRFREKYDALAALGIELFFCPRFDNALAHVSPDAFARTLLIERLHARHVVIGDDFRYASRRAGNIESLRAAGKRFGFAVEQVGSVLDAGIRVSSTLIRELLAAGDMARASEYLGRPYRMSGRVIEGKRLGRTLGFPTANIAIHRRTSPVHGIFAVELVDGKGERLAGVANIGTRPTVDGGRVLLEVHVFDFDGDLYGQYVHVDFVERLRDEVRFDDIPTMVEQMHRDCENARRILGRDGKGTQS